MNRLFLLAVVCFCFVTPDKIHAQALPVRAEDRLYTDLAQALQQPDSVFRLRIKKCKKCDSLPDEIFLFKNLRELDAHGIRLNVLNNRISELQQLQVLNLGKNHLVRLPQTIGQLVHLKTLIINRNKIEELPESIGNLKELETIDAWSTNLYVLPNTLANISKTLKTIDLRQVPLRDSELEAMEKLLPATKIFYTSVCECDNNR